jgi:hypothetical protein
VQITPNTKKKKLDIEFESAEARFHAASKRKEKQCAKIQRDIHPIRKTETKKDTTRDHLHSWKMPT